MQVVDQVDADGEVVRNTWEDCEEGCPGTDFECNEGFLFNIEGECVNGTQAPGLLSRIGKPCLERRGRKTLIQRIMK